MYTFPDAKDPSDKLDYPWDLTMFLGADTISSCTWVVDQGITKESSAVTTKVATIWLSGGVPGKDYTFTGTVVTAAGRIKNRTFMVRVRET